MARGSHRAPYALRLTTPLTPHTAHLAQYTSRLTPFYASLTPHTSHLAPHVLLATRHLPPTHFLLARGVRPARGCGGAARVGSALIRRSSWTQSLQSRRRVAELSPSRRPAESCSGSSAGGQARRRGSRIQSDVDPLPASNCGGQLQLRRPTNVVSVPLHGNGGWYPVNAARELVL